MSNPHRSFPVGTADKISEWSETNRGHALPPWQIDLLRQMEIQPMTTQSLPTLADMTPEERQACVGMWCDNLASTAQEPAPVVLECVLGDLCWVLHIDLHGERSCFSLDRVAPRPDLMRAWSPDGTPSREATDE